MILHDEQHDWPILPAGFSPQLSALDAPLPHVKSVVIHQGEVLLAHGQLPQQAWSADIAAWCIGLLDGEPVQLLLPAQPPAGLIAHGLRSCWGLLPNGDYALAGRAMQLASFLRQHRFCGACGGPTQLVAGGEPSLVCTQCGQAAWPRHSPAVMVLIRRGPEILLARSPHFTPGIYGLIAGFVDAGETVEQAAHREVAEEVGLQISNLRWYASQSWPYPHSLMLGFTADYAGGEIVCQPGEIEDAGWYHPARLPSIPSGASLAHRMIRSACEGLGQDKR